jgi:glycerophosphoryl diester phosphodiesterase
VHQRRSSQAVVVGLVLSLSGLGCTEASKARFPSKEPLRLEYGARPFELVRAMAPSKLKDELLACAEQEPKRSDFSIGHRGAPLGFPEHTRESYEAAARQGAGIIECDVVFTKDRKLVCRHSECDLHRTTNILATPLAAKCNEPFTPADPVANTSASAECCTTELTLEEYKMLCGKSDAANPRATSVDEYLQDLSTCGTLLSHAESIELFRELGVKFAPELKVPAAPTPAQGTYTREARARALVDEYESAGIEPKDVFLQSFELNDVLYWIRTEPEFARQAVYLDSRVETPAGYERAVAGMQELADQGVRIVAPPLWALVRLDGDAIVPSDYARAAKAAGLDLITWTLERSIDNDGDVFEWLDVLARDVGVRGVFSDWPATVTYYANCKGL